MLSPPLGRRTEPEALKFWGLHWDPAILGNYHLECRFRAQAYEAKGLRV